MNITLVRAVRWVLLVIGLSTSPRPVAAQQSRIAPTEIGQIVDEVLAALIPQGQRFSRIPVTDRGVFFDHARTVAAFGHDSTLTESPFDLGMRTAVRSGWEGLLDDCSQFGNEPCSQLGWGVYVWIQPVSVTTSEALVRAYIFWPDRGSTVFEKGVAPGGRASLVGFMTEVYLSRSIGGRWKFAKTGTTAVSE